MSKLHEFNQVERQLKELLDQMEQMKQDEEVAKAKEFQEHLNMLIEDSQLAIADVAYVVSERFGAAAFIRALEQLSKGGVGRVRAPVAERKPRKIKTWTNTVTGESRSGKKIPPDVSRWIEEHGQDKVTVTEAEAG